jgi:hypothetical protein
MLIPFPAPSSDPAPNGAVPDLSAAEIVCTPRTPDLSKAESDGALMAMNMSPLEVSILAVMWNHHPRPLLVSEIYLAVRSSAGGALSPCATAVTRLAGMGALNSSGSPSFHYQLTRSGIFAAFYLAISGASDQFSVARVADEHSNAGLSSHDRADFDLLNYEPSREDAIDSAADNVDDGGSLNDIVFDILDMTLKVGPVTIDLKDACHSGCGRIATGTCECGNAVCSTHRYNASGQHDPAGICSTCYDEIIAGG